MPNVLDGYLTRRELAAQFRVSERTIWRWHNDGLPCTKLGDRPLYNIESVKAWLESRERQTPAEASK